MNGRHSEDSSHANRFPGFMAGLLSGGLTGMVAGAAAVWLTAPRTGKQTRSQIQKQGAKLRNQAVDSVEEVVTEAGDKAQKFADTVHKGVGDLQQQAHDMLGEAKK